MEGSEQSAYVKKRLLAVSHPVSATSETFFSDGGRTSLRAEALDSSRFSLFLERGGEGERKGERHQCVRDTSIGCLSHVPYWPPGPQPRHVP